MQQRVRDGEGGAFIGWIDTHHADPDIYLQRFTRDGAVAPGWPEHGLGVAVLPHSQYHLDMAPDSAGGTYLVWEDYRGGGAGDIYATRITPAGQSYPGWPEGGLAVCTEAAEQSEPRVATDGSGGAYIVWQDRRSGVLEVYGQHLAGDGQPFIGWPENGRRFCAAAPVAFAPQIAVDNAGSGLIIWQHLRAEEKSELCAAPINAFDTGCSSPPIVLAESVDEFGEVGLGWISAHTLLVSWTERASGQTTLRAQTIDLGGGASVTWTTGGIAVSTGSLAAAAPFVLADQNGGALIAWEQFRQQAGDIYVQRVTSAGQVSADWPAGGLAACLAPGDQYRPHLDLDSRGGVLATWVDGGTGANGTVINLEASILRFAPQLLRTKASPGRAQILWRVRPGTLGQFRVDRRIEEDPWQVLQTLTPDDSSHLPVNDATVAEGVHVEYRLAIRDGGNEVLFQPVSLEIPRSPTTLTLTKVIVRGTAHRVLLSIGLPRGPAPQIDLMDVVGRRVVTRRLEGLDPGDQVVDVGLPGSLPSGVYFLRLVQGNATRIAKVVYVH
jgi:hypothetical protein